MISKKHKVLLFGQSVFGNLKPNLSIDYCDVDFISFPGEYNKLSRLAAYDLVILDYSAFLVGGSVREHEQEVFAKQMLEALDKGTCFCFLHYKEQVPGHDRYNSDDGYMAEEGIEICYANQIGFRWLREFDIRPYLLKTPVISASVERNEFKVYQERWGASKNVFKTYKDGKIGEMILSGRSGYALGFALPIRRGRILYLPCQRDFNRPDSITECLTTLINSAITYITKSSTEIPVWAQTPLFRVEQELYENLSNLQSKIEKVKADLDPYQVAKTLAFLSEYEFEERVPEFFITHLKLNTRRHEQFKEDFWIVDSESKKIVIGETKSCVRGFKKNAIYSLYNHRDSAGLDDTFPAILVINAHLNANSWEEKVRPIDPQDYECAADNNILLLRIEDLLFFWNSIIEKRHTSEELLSHILKHKGWMEVQMNGNVVMHPSDQSPCD